MSVGRNTFLQIPLNIFVPLFLINVAMEGILTKPMSNEKLHRCREYSWIAANVNFLRDMGGLLSIDTINNITFVPCFVGPTDAIGYLYFIYSPVDIVFLPL